MVVLFFLFSIIAFGQISSIPGAIQSSVTYNNTYTGNSPVINVSDYANCTDSSDDKAGIQSAINAAAALNAPNAAVYFGDSSKTCYLSDTVTLKPGIRYYGQAKIKNLDTSVSGHQMFKGVYQQSDNITIDGLTLDASGRSGIVVIQVDGGGATPAFNFVLVNSTLMNSKSTPGEGDAAFYNSSGLDTAVFYNNTFIDCPYGIEVNDANNLTIANNTFIRVVYHNAISVYFHNPSFTVGNKIRIQNNKATGLRRMGVEIWGNTAKPVDSLVSNNLFAYDSTTVAGPYAISNMIGTQCRIEGNTLYGSTDGFGIELGVTGCEVSNNKIFGFQHGIAIQQGLNSKIFANEIYNSMQAGIDFTNNGQTKTGHEVAYNTIVNAGWFGIWAETGLYGGANIHDNRIVRKAYLTATDTDSAGIALTAATAGITLTANIVEQVAPYVTGYPFYCFRFNGSTPTGTTVTRNQCSSQAQGGTVGVYINDANGVANVTFNGNMWSGLGSSSSGASSTATVTNNRVVNCGATGSIF